MVSGNLNDPCVSELLGHPKCSSSDVRWFGSLEYPYPLLTEVDEYLIRFGIGFEADSKPGGNFGLGPFSWLLMVWDVLKKSSVAFGVRLIMAAATIIS